jgi:glycosyltransferase involved in cell wall biosynthesis
MRILFLASTPFFSVRGTPLAVRNLLLELSRKNWHIEMLTFPIGEDVNIPNVRITRCGNWLGIKNVPFGPSWRKALLDFAIFLELFRRLLAGYFSRRYRYDVIHALDEMTFGCWLLKPLIRVPIIYDMDSSIVEQITSTNDSLSLTRAAESIERKMISVSQVIVPVCDSLAKRISEFDQSKHIVVLNDLSQFTPDDVDSAVGSRYLSPTLPSRPIFMYVGNFARYQGTDLLLEAYDKHKKSGRPGSLIICGGNRAEIEQYEQKYPDVIFLGTVDPAELPPLFRLADWLVSPRTVGTNTPMKIYDYLCAGRPIIASDLPTHRQVLDESCALLFNPTERDLHQTLNLASTLGPRGVAMGKAGRDKWLRRYSHDVFSSKIDEIYRLALGN